jgi:hypothetical protein
MKRNLMLLVLAGSLPISAYAMESATVGSQATQATVGVLNIKIDSLMAALQAMVNGMSTCNAQRKFYAPSDPKKDASGCVGIQDYQLTMNGTNGVTTPSGQVAATNNGGWSGNFNGAGGLVATGTSSPGLQGSSTGSYGVYGTSSNSWSGVFQSSTYGVYGQGSSWAGYFVGPVYASTNVQTPTLCLNGDCRSAWPGSYNFGGIYTLQWAASNGAFESCVSANPYTGGCFCPGGYSATETVRPIEGNWAESVQWCYK